MAPHIKTPRIGRGVHATASDYRTGTGIMALKGLKPWVAFV